MLALLGAVFIFGGLGELLAPEPATAPRIVLVVGGAIAALGGLTLIVLAIRALVEARGLPGRHA